jgi:hypothetical protein
LQSLEKLKTFFCEAPNTLYEGVQTIADLRVVVDQYNTWSKESEFCKVMEETLGLEKSAVAKFARARRIPIPLLHGSRPLGLGMIPIHNPPRYAAALDRLADETNQWCLDALDDNGHQRPTVPYKAVHRAKLPGIKEELPRTTPHAEKDPRPFLGRKRRELNDAGIRVRVPEGRPHLSDDCEVISMQGPIVFVPNCKNKDEVNAQQMNLTTVFISVDRARQLKVLEENRLASQTLDVKACPRKIQKVDLKAYRSAVYHVLPNKKHEAGGTQALAGLTFVSTTDDGGLALALRLRRGTIRLSDFLEHIKPLCTGTRLAEIAFNVLKDVEVETVSLQ